ncbi:MAG: hypothetical protein ABII00_01925 [Elusimicrobiota bacterium]
MKRHKKTLWACGGAACLIFVLLWQQVQATRLSYAVGHVRGELKERSGSMAYLRLEAERLHTPDRLAEAARRRLGMAPPSPETIVFLGSSVSRPQPPRENPGREEPRYLSRLMR